MDAEHLADPAVALARSWLRLAAAAESRSESAAATRLASLMDDPDAVRFTMRFIDRVARPESRKAAAHQLAVLLEDQTPPAFLAAIDRIALRAGAFLAPLLPDVVLPLAKRRMRALVGHLVADAEPVRLSRHLARLRSAGFEVNVNLLGEAILGEGEARRRLERNLDLIARSDIDYVSVKITSIASQLNLWAYDHSRDRVADRLRELYGEAARSSPPTFVNLDMEAYEDLDLTIDAFKEVGDELPGVEAGIALQAYLPDTFPRLQDLVAWANRRSVAGGAPIKIRLVKGANLAMEDVTSEIHGWPRAPYATKPETDANFKRCLDWLFSPDRLEGVRVGVASHNLFDVAFALLLARERKVVDRIEFEMLQGMAPTHSTVVHADAGSMLLYTPVVAAADFDVAIGYLFRRLEENSAPENFLHALFTSDEQALAAQEEEFRASLAARHSVSSAPRRDQDRSAPPAPVRPGVFVNEPDTDPTVAANRAWMDRARTSPPAPVREPVTTDPDEVGRRVAAAGPAQERWRSLPVIERRSILLDVATELGRRRADLISAMVHEGAKTVAQADPEVSEAIDFARYYAFTMPDDDAFAPLGVVAVIPPWNFPVAIPCGGVMAALAAGNSVLFKPAPETPRCAEIVAEAAWAAGVPRDVLQFIRTPDDEAGTRLVTSADGVILTGSWDTARLFQSWKPDIRLFAETSGKNALIITPHADLDLAAADLVKSAFGHAGQKCSAASLGILVGEVFTSERFRRQLIDATTSLTIGPADDPASDVGPLILPARGPLQQAFSDPDARWVVPPRRLDEHGRLWSPGIRDDVEPGSWFHRTECFGPVLGLMAARDLDEAIALQNSSPFGLTGGIHSLDPHEIERWIDAVDVGNAYVNRHITGAIVQRQPFGGRKRSSVGPGAKAGGPNYVAQLGTWHDGPVPERDVELAPGVARMIEGLGLSEADRAWVATAARDDEHWWRREFGRGHDPAGLRVEANVFRYQPRSVVIRVEGDPEPRRVARAAAAMLRATGRVAVSADHPIDYLDAGMVTIEPFAALVARLPAWSRIRMVGDAGDVHHTSANAAEIDLAVAPVVASGRREPWWYLQEQAVSRTMHRFGNLL